MYNEEFPGKSSGFIVRVCWAMGILIAIPPIFCTVILYGGVGNQLLAIEALRGYANLVNCVPVLGFFVHRNRHLQSFSPWGGHPRPSAGTWCEFIDGVDCLPPGLWDRVALPRLLEEYRFAIASPDEFIPFPRDRVDITTALSGYFFNHRYRQALGPVPWRAEFQESVERQHRYLVGTGSCSVAVHLRLYYDGEPDMNFALEREQPSPEFYRNAIAMFPSQCRILVFSDKSPEPAFLERILGRRGLSLVREDCPVRTLALMSLSTHRILASSTLSACAAQRQRDAGSLTVVWEGFKQAHGDEFFDPGDIRIVWMK